MFRAGLEPRSRLCTGTGMPRSRAVELGRLFGGLGGIRFSGRLLGGEKMAPAHLGRFAPERAYALDPVRTGFRRYVAVHSLRKDDRSPRGQDRRRRPAGAAVAVGNFGL